MRIKVHCILNLGVGESHEEFQKKFKEWVNDNGWDGESVGSIKMPDEIFS